MAGASAVRVQVSHVLGSEHTSPYTYLILYIYLHLACVYVLEDKKYKNIYIFVNKLWEVVCVAFC